MSDARNQWSKTPLLLRLGSGERERAHGTAMEGAEKRYHVLPLGVIASQFKRALNRFRTRVAVVDFVGAGHGGNLRQTLRQGDHVLVIKIRARHVNQLGSLFLNGRDHMRMAMSGRSHSDAGGKIEELVSVHVGDNNSATLLRD